MSDLVTPWSGEPTRHRAAREPLLEPGVAPTRGDARWSLPGRPALYLPSDIGTIAGEYAAGAEGQGGSDWTERELYRIPLRLERLLDLSDPAVAAAAGAGQVEDWLADDGAVRRTAGRLLARLPGLQALLVPSSAFVDRHDRYAVVVYPDALDPLLAFGPPVPIGRISFAQKAPHVRLTAHSTPPRRDGGQ